MSGTPAPKRGPGRPLGSCKPASERLAEIVNLRFRVTDPLYDALCRRAVRERKSVPALVRELVEAEFPVSKKNSTGPSGPTLGA